MQKNNDNNIISHFLKYQAIYGIIVSFIITWTLMGARIDALERNDVKQDAKIEAYALSLAEINSRLASIETSLSYIKERLK